MADQAAPEEGSTHGPRAAAQEKKSPLAPANQPLRPPTMGQTYPPNVSLPPATFRRSLNAPAPFPVSPANMQTFLDFNSQPVWAGNNMANFHPFLPMGNRFGHIAAPPAGTGFNFAPAGAMVNPFGRDPFMQLPMRPFDPSASEAQNLAMDPIQIPAEPLTKGEDKLIKGEEKPSGIPLICVLCPKQPKFSDVSHLLTHISSKSHLAAQFKLQHSGKSEDKRTLERYQQWSDDNGVDKLVANRIAAKESKRPAKRSRLASVESKTGRNFKLEADDGLVPHLQSAPLRPSPHTWHLHAPRDNSADVLFDAPQYNDYGAYPFPGSPQSSAYIKQETSRSGTNTANTSFLAEAAEGDAGDDSSKLKGIVYPGMGLFDSATADQKRRRNQKKHASVVLNMEMTSALIGPDEEVWDSTMSEVTRTRNVYDSPSIDGSSPDSHHDELPSATKKGRGRRSAVASTGPRRQTRAATRAANSAKVSKRRSTRQKKKLIKVEDEFDSEDDSSQRLDDDEEEEDDNAAAGGDVFQERHQIRQDAPVGSADNRFDFSFRNAMHNLPSNTPLMTSSSLFHRPNQSFFPGFGMKENDSMAFAMPQPGAMNGFLAQNRQTMQSNASALNPLYLQRQDTYPFLYGGPSFDPTKPPNSAFPAMPNADYGGMDSAPSFQPGQNDEFDG